MLTNPTIAKYLKTYAEPCSLRWCEQLLSKPPTQPYQNVLVIPCYDEIDCFWQELLPATSAKTLVIIVINLPAIADKPLHAKAAIRTIAMARTHGLGEFTSSNTPQDFVRFDLTSFVEIALVDCATRPLPKHQGVGLARKIGSDLALALFQAGKIEKPWIYQSDADAQLPTDYFSRPLPVNHPQNAACLFPYQHRSPNPELHARGLLYELHLRRYQHELTRAGSMYGFATLGSSLVVSMLAYAKVRGFPKRNAAEDFYLLNKLVKVGDIEQLSGDPIVVAARDSQRVPFGTGPALRKMSEDPTEFLSYHPQSFSLLKLSLNMLATSANERCWSPGIADSTQHARIEEIFAELGFFDFFQKAVVQHYKPTSLQKALNQWFDGFRTLRFLHLARRFYPDQPLLETMAIPVEKLADVVDGLRTELGSSKRQYSTQ